MRKFIYALYFSSVCSSLNTTAQDCGTNITQEQLKHIDKFISSSWKANSVGRSNNVLVDIPLRFHSITRDDGTGGLTEANVTGILNQLNGYYSSAGIRFTLPGGVNYIRDSESFDFNAANEGVVAVGNDVPGNINVYFFNTLISGGTPLCGYTRFPPSSDRVFVAYGCVIGETTLEHELGHYFTLFHTHGTTNTGTTDELVNQSNCTTAGDRICDTEADPNLSGKVNESCAYTDTATDTNGDIYMPNTHNIMSYSRDECQDLFTQGQYDRIRQGFENSRAYLDFVTDGFTANFISGTSEICIDNTISFTGIGFGVTDWAWTFEGGTPATSSEESPSVTYTQGGEFDVTLTATGNGGETVIVTKRNYVAIVDPVSDAIQEQIADSFNNTISDKFSIVNPDLGFTFQYSDIDFNEESNSGSIFVNNFDYFTENLTNVDELESQFLNTEGVAKFSIEFDYAYTFRPGGEIKDGKITVPVYDSLKVSLSTGCDPNEILLWNSGGQEMSTVEATNEAYVPINSEWRHIELEFEVEDGDEAYLAKFTSNSFNGNNLYLDNISIIPDYSVNVPFNFRRSNVDANSVTLRWIDDSNNELGFVVERSIDGGSFEEIATVAPNTQIYVDETVQNGSLYQYRLFATGFGENKSELTSTIEVREFLITAVENEIESTFKLFPNPNNGEINVLLGGISNEAFDIQIVDIAGQVVFEKNGMINSSNEPLNLDTNLHQGFYILNLTSTSVKYSYSFIVK